MKKKSFAKVGFVALLVWGLFTEPVAEENIHFSSCEKHGKMVTGYS